MVAENSGDWIPIASIGKYLGIRVSVKTAHRWIRRGVRGVVLGSCRIGGRYYTLRCWLDEFITAQSITPASSTESTVGTPETPTSRRREIEAAEREFGG